jgi:hypothetical protein
MEQYLLTLFFEMAKEMNKTSRNFFKSLGTLAGCSKRKKKKK